jgi:hypothetical protein
VPLSERERYQIALTHRLLGETQRLAAAHGVDFRIFHPRGYNLDLALKNFFCIKDEADGEHYIVDMQDMLGFIDTSELAKLVIVVDIASPEKTTLSSVDWHLNRVGNEKTMDALPDVLTRAGKIR